MWYLTYVLPIGNRKVIHFSFHIIDFEETRKPKMSHFCTLVLEKTVTDTMIV